MRRTLVGLTLFLSAVACRSDDPRAADLVLNNGKIVTMDDGMPQASALAVTGDRIVAVGSDADIEPFIGSDTEVINLGGDLAIPGFIEGHGHFMSLGRSKINLDLTEATSWDEIVRMVAAVAGDMPRDAWIEGRGWHQEKWNDVPEGNVDGVPTHATLSAASPNNPVLLTHASGHAAFANRRALELSGITPQTRDPDGGTIVRDASGAPTGLLRENAQDLAEAALGQANARRSPEDRRAEDLRAVALAGEDLWAKGVTGFHDAGASFETIDFYRELADAGQLPVRLYVMVRYETNDAMAARLPDYRMVGYGGGFLTVRSIKRQIDGALGSHGAWLLEPYLDMPTSTGLVLEPVEEIRRTAEIALEQGFQLNTHAIGDRANREVLDIYESVFGDSASQDLRWRIEHAQHVHPDDIPRFAELGVIASMQGVHATSDGSWVASRLGPERVASGAYVWRRFLNAGVVVTNGTDAPVEDVDPLASFYASVSRRLADGTVFMPSERMSREEALRSYTINVAYSAFAEDELGSIAPGKYADIVVLSQDIMTVPEEFLPNTRVEYTIVGGKVRYSPDGIVN